MPKSSTRHQRIEAQLQRSLAELLPRAVKDPRVRSVTITAVKLAPDLGTARIFFLPFGGQGSTDDLGAGLRSASGFLRGEVARELGLRHAPRLEFVLDTDLQRAQALSDLIEQAVATDRQRSSGRGEAD
jgi:ribosome-binding factor A